MVNKVTLVGRLGKDPEARQFESNAKLVNFTMATTERYKDREGNKVEQTEWHNVAVWRKGLADVAEQYLKKGTLIYLEGRLRTRKWDDKDGNTRYTTEVICDNFQMLGGKSENGGNSGSYQSAQESAPAAPSPVDVNEIADDLPF